jgi:hypothetical protein
VPVHAHEALTGTVTPEAKELERMVSDMYLRIDGRELDLDAYLNS